MDASFHLKYKDEVEALKDAPDFEARGDQRYLRHEDVEARLYWAFCRPSGSCREQLQDPDPLVSVMAFNHSRMAPFERFSLVHPEVISRPELRQRIARRARMLFRSLVDEDFSELNRVLERFPVFLDLAVDQLLNGRLWNEDLPADDLQASRFLDRAGAFCDDRLIRAVQAKLRPVAALNPSELKSLLLALIDKKAALHPAVIVHYATETEQWLSRCELHPLQRKSLEQLLKKLRHH